MVSLSEETLWFAGIALSAVTVWLLMTRATLKSVKTELARSSAFGHEAIKRIQEKEELLRVCAESAASDAFKIAGLSSLVDEKSRSFPWLRRARSEFDDLVAEKIAYQLRTKSHPARRAAQEVTEFRKKAREFEHLYRKIRSRQEYSEYLFPWLSDLFDEDIETLLETNPIEKVEGDEHQDRSNQPRDPAQAYLSRADYDRLSEPERNQVALDRYLRSRKSNWQIGREFERFVGHRLEQENYRVCYFGATEGLDDLGRDLIATKKEETLIVQCKYWSSNKTLHEKHIYQLYGTCMDYIIENNIQPDSRQGQLFHLDSTQKIVPLLLTTGRLSERAKRAAKLLQVDFEELPLHSWDYPRIKCNISKRDGTKIYHLPFDQQYDKVKIDRSLGEFFAASCADAHAKGFRRAWRWRGN